MDDAAAIARAELGACLARVALADHAALEYLYKRTSAKLFGICKRILSDRAAAEDVLQEVFLIVWNRAGQFDPARGVSAITWLAAIARNRALDRLRARSQGAVSLDEAAQIADTRPLADYSMETAERATRLSDCLSGLDERAATAIKQAFFGGLTYQMLATRADMPLATMKSLVRRGLLRLRTCLDS
ncbi:RNA polymerase sigma factor [Acidocella aquatica]|uniref:RNA polymerase sigma factor n=1 Tax=Acidocella aquatica TaxID=1922313 RepID=A0ABQ6A107_9PROT|nr:sigma-70 family RNA polymerase sigma factor [Acidocella aquatica]GLR65342.1 RNA polymerase sigma factor [Acidocella aquatica]